jgi:LmbE family N-acetylglucosaminyl deacetylase
MSSKVMAIAAHAGDALFTMGSPVAQNVYNGGSGVFVSLTLGERGNPANITSERYGEMQRNATEKAAKMLGAEVEILNYPDAELPAEERVALEVCDLIRKHKPTVVITHWNGSWHKDHQTCHVVVRDAIFYAGLPGIARKLPPHDAKKLFFAENWEDATNFQPDTYLDITPVYKKWLEACDLYPMWRGQTGFFRYYDYYRSLAVMRGSLSGVEYAVALMSDPNQRRSAVRSFA